MLENDLILTRFLDARGGEISGEELAALDALLSLSDVELWNLLSGRVEPTDKAVAPLVDTLRAI
jgi:succinate dehydrogenase flavin-adding protein (antitoxin of CptAB toxin-antitoxin module)